MKTQAAFKRILVGRPMASGELGHTLLPKTIALPVFSSDALSSVAYATGEIILVLGVVGAAAVANVVPISIAVAALLAIVVLSYRQTVAAYPNGGGAYIVSYDNLGMYPGLLAAAALLLDYVLTVSVSTVAGVDALVSSAPQLADYKVPLGIFFVLLVALANLRGVRESGTFFALPTYGFILCMYVLLGTGLIKCLGGCPVVDTPEGYGGAAGAVTLLLVLKAFSAGTTALTGVEAISNGVIILTFFACLLIVIFAATLNHLIQLYLVGLFISFTLSQAGMVVHWRKSREKGWRRSAAINGFGATLTAVVLIVVIQSKFLEGAYVVITGMPVMIYAMRSVHRHYTELRAQLAHPERVPADRRPGHQHMVILVERVDAATARAVGYARSVRPADLHAVAFDDSVQDEWAKLAPQVELAVIPTGESRKARLKKHLRSLRKDLGRDDFLTLVVPEMLQSKGLWQLLRQPGLQRLKASFLREPGIQVLDVPLDRSEAAAGSGAHRSIEPARNYVLVLVAGVHNATLQAIEYAETLRPTDLRAVSFGLDPAATERLGNDWLATGIPHPLEIDDSPFRDIGGSLIDYVHRFKPDGVKRVVTVVMPEFIVSKRRHQLLHGQTALIIKSRLLFERGVVAVSVPYHIED